MGDGEGCFAYKSFVTREELAEVAYRIVSGLVENFNGNTKEGK